MKIKLLVLGGLLILCSCKTYTISPDSLKSQLIKTNKTQKVAQLNSPQLYGNFGYLANDIKFIEVVDKNGNQLSIPNSPALEMKVTHKNGSNYHFYFDTTILENDTLKASRSRFLPHLVRHIPYDSIVKIEIQDGGKNFKYAK